MMPRRMIKKHKLSGLKHSGEIPKGCNKVVVRFVKEFLIQEPKQKCTVAINAEIIAGSNKAFNQKHRKVSFEVQKYFDTNSIQDAIDDGYEVKFEEIKEDGQEAVVNERPEG